MGQLITSLLNQYSTDSDTFRQTSQENRMSMYLDDYEHLTKVRLKEQFSPENYKEMFPMIARHDNVLKKIVNLKAMNYKDVPKRKWIVGEEEDDTYSEVIGRSNLNSESITLEKFAHVNNLAFNRIKVVNGKIVYEAIAPENINVLQDEKNPWEINTLEHTIVKNSSRGEVVQTRHIWTNGKSSMDDNDFPSGFFQVMRIDEHGDESEDEKQPNPYIDPNTKLGIIPYIDMRVVKGVDYWGDTINSDLYEGTLQINVLQTYLNHLMKMASYRQLFTTGKIDTATLQGKKLDPTTIINIKGVAGGTEPSIQSIEIAKDPNELITAINRYKAILSDNHSVSFSADAMGGQKQTAEAMTINRQGIIDLRKDVLPLFREYENKLAWYTIIIANTPTNKSGLGKSIDINGDFEIDFQEPKFITDPKMEFELDLLKVNNKVFSMADLLIKYNPDIKTEDKAIQQAQRNQEINDEVSGVTENNEIEEAVQGLQITEPEDTEEGS